MKILRIILLILYGIVTVPTILALLSPVVSPVKFYWPAVFALLLPFLLLSQMAFLVYWAIKWRWPALLPLFVLILAVPAIDRTIQIGYSPVVQDENAFQLLIYNQHDLRELKENEKISDEEAEDLWKKFERSIDGFDIMAFQEYGGNSEEFFSPRKEFPHMVNCVQSQDIRIYSRYPIINSGCIDLIQKRNQALWADIKLPSDKAGKESSDTIRIYNFHLASNVISHISSELAEQPSLDPEYLYTNVRTMFSRYKFSAPIRVRELELILEHSKDVTRPVILCGDFNDIPQSYLYRQVAEQYNDSFVHRGRGVGDTYAAEIPFLRIDYIFASDDFEVMAYKKGREIRFSDHYPVVASLKLR